MHNLSQRYGKLLSVGLSVICSVFLVAVVVSAATTIGAAITTAGAITTTGGDLTVSGVSTIGTTDTVDATTTIKHGLIVGYKTNYIQGVFNVNTNGNVSASGTLKVWGATTLTGAATLSSTLDVSGLTTLAKASSTLLSAYNGLYVGTTATTTISGTTTSTFASSVILNEAGANTSTMQIGHASASKGQGGCIALAADDGAVLYLMVTSVAGRYELATSTVARDCGY